MWELFIPKAERHCYRSEIMEGPHGGSGRTFSEDWASWDTRTRIGFCVAVAVFVFIIVAVVTIWALVG